MNPFISIEEFQTQYPENFILIYCLPGLKLPYEHIPGSFLYNLEDDGDLFIRIARSVELDEEKTLICYDTGDFQYSCKAYWGFRASGFDDVKVLAGGLKSWKESNLETSKGSPSLINKAPYPYLPFNSSIVLTKYDFLRKDAYYQQITYIDTMPFEILNSDNRLINQIEVSQQLADRGILFIVHKPTIIHGKFAGYLGLLLKYLGAKTVSIVIDDTHGECPNSNEKIRKAKSVKTSESRSIVQPPPRSFVSEENTHYESKISNNSKKKIEPGRSVNICSSCILM